MNMINFNEFSGFLKDGKGNYIIVSQGTILGPFKRDQIGMMSDLIRAVLNQKEQEG